MNNRVLDREASSYDLDILNILKLKKYVDRKEAYDELKQRFPEHLILFSEAYMYAVINEDAKKLNEIFGYKIMKSDKVCFPKNGGFKKVGAKFSVIVVGPRLSVIDMHTHDVKVKCGEVLCLNYYDPKDVEEEYFLEYKGYLLSTKRAYLENNRCGNCIENNVKSCTLLKCPIDAIKYFKTIAETKYQNLVSLDNSCVIVVPNSKGEQNIILSIFAKNTFINSKVVYNMFESLILENNNKNGASRANRVNRKEMITQYKILESDHYEILKFRNIIILDDVSTTDSTLDAFEQLISTKVSPTTSIYKLALSKTL